MAKTLNIIGQQCCKYVKLQNAEPKKPSVRSSLEKEVTMNNSRFLKKHDENAYDTGGVAGRVRDFVREEDGQTLVEYGLLISLLALTAVAAITIFGRKVGNMWGANGQKYPDPPT